MNPNEHLGSGGLVDQDKQGNAAKARKGFSHNPRPKMRHATNICLDESFRNAPRQQQANPTIHDRPRNDQILIKPRTRTFY
jgi:hypothetical protein